MRAAAEFHGVSIQLVRAAADLHDAHDVAILVTKELLNIGALLRFYVGNFGPRNRRVLRDLLVHHFLEITHLLLRQRRARKIERQLLRSHVASLLHRLATNEFVQRPVQNMCDGMVSLDRAATRRINAQFVTGADQETSRNPPYRQALNRTYRPASAY